MLIRPAQPADLARLIDIDGTIESSQYLHVDRGGEELAVSWRLEERPLREKLVNNNAVDEDGEFRLKQVVNGIEEGIAIVAEHDDQLVGLALGQPDTQKRTLNVVELRVDYDMRREGVGSAMLFQLIAKARELEMRAVAVTTQTTNIPAARFLLKAGFDLGGVDTHFRSNHDLVKEAVALFWYAALD
jgi:N-acetylglutamate synthase-like GNAT family acetyltransferase